MKLLVTTGWAAHFVAEMQDEFPQVEFLSADGLEELVALAPQAEAVLGWIQPEVFAAASGLKWVHSPSAGVEWMAGVPGLRESDVVVTNARGAHAATIAEHCFGMLIFLARDFADRYEEQKRKEWVRPIPKASVGISGMTMGVVGLGNIGRAIALRAAAFDMRVIAVDAHSVAVPDYVSDFQLLDGLPNLMAQSNVVVVATPITPETRGMISRDLLKAMLPASYLMVMSRGGIVDEETVVEMLHSGDLAGAGFDVTEIEPLPQESGLWHAPNCFITPHCSPSSVQTSEIGRAIIRENVRRYLAGETLTNIVDKKLGY